MLVLQTVQYQIVPGQVILSDQFTDAQTLSTLAGEPLTVRTCTNTTALLLFGCGHATMQSCNRFAVMLAQAIHLESGLRGAESVRTAGLTEMGEV